MSGTIADTGLSDTPVFPLDPGAKVILGLLAPYVGAVFLETFLYGLYTILFGICIYVLLRRHPSLHYVLLLFAFLMFALASADVGYTYYLVFGRMLGGRLTFRSLYPKCFVVWGRSKRVILGPFLLLIATTVCGYLFEGASSTLFRHAGVYLGMTLALNLILTVLTAGRIWYLRRRTRKVLGEGLLQRYNATLAILVESGVLYSTYMILDLAFQNDPVASTILDAGLIQVVGIMPTLIIVQVGLGRAMHDMDADANCSSTLDPLSRIEANKAAGASFVAVPNGHGGYGYYGPGYFRSSFNGTGRTRSDSQATSVQVGLNGLNGNGDRVKLGELAMGMRSAGVLSDATTTVDSRSDLALDVSGKRQSKEGRMGGVRVPDVLRLDTWGRKTVPKGESEAGNYTPAPQRRQRTRKGTGDSSGRKSQRSWYRGHEPSNSLDGGVSLQSAPSATNYAGSPMKVEEESYRYPSSDLPLAPRPRADSEVTVSQELEYYDSSTSSMRKATFFADDGDDGVLPPSSESYPHHLTHTPHSHSHSRSHSHTRSPTASSPLSSPPITSSTTTAADREVEESSYSPRPTHRRLPSTPPPPGIALPSPPRSPRGIGLVSPLSRLVDDIARPAHAHGGGIYFDRGALSAAWGHGRWPGARERVEREQEPERGNGHGHMRLPSGTTLAAFPDVPVSLAPSRASSINESCYSPI